MAQFSSLWWARAHVQLLAQAATKQELLPLGAMHNRWSTLLHIANEEGVKTAIKYDEATWKRAEAQVKAGVSFDARRLQSVDGDVLSELKRRRESEAAPRFPPRHQQPTQTRSGWKEQQQPQESWKHQQPQESWKQSGGQGQQYQQWKGRQQPWKEHARGAAPRKVELRSAGW